MFYMLSTLVQVFRTGGFFNKVDASTARKLLQKCWVDVYAGALDFESTDAGTNLNSAEFKEQASTLGSVVQFVPIEAHDRIGQVKRGHRYRRMTYGSCRLLFIPSTVKNVFYGIYSDKG